MRRRPFRRKLNHTAVGVSGIRLRREAVIPWSLQSAFTDADFAATERDQTLEFTFRAPSTAGFPAVGDHRVPVAFLGSRVAESLGYGGGPGYVRSRTVDAPITLNLARLAGDWFWELYGHPGTFRVAVKAAPFIRQHLAIVIDKAGNTMSIRNSNDGEGNEVTASMGLSVNATRQCWRFRGPAEKANTPLDPPHFELECIRLWHTARSAAEIQANRDYALPGDTPGLTGQWTGDSGTRDYLLNEAGPEMPMFFTADYPSYYDGSFASGVEIANVDRGTPSRYVLQNNDAALRDSMKAALDTTYDSLRSTSGGAFFQNALQYGMSIKVRMLETNLGTTTGEFRGIHTGQFEIAVEPTTGKVFAFDPQHPASIADSNATTIGPDESHVISVVRDQTSLALYIDGVLVQTVAGLGIITNSAFQTNKYGTAVSWSAIPGSIIVEELVHWYGKPDTAGGVNLVTAFPDMDYPDDIERRISGGLIEFYGSYLFTNGSPTVDAGGSGFTPRVGDFLIDLSSTERRVAYRVAATVGTTLTLASNYMGQSGTVAAAVTRCLFASKFDNAWSTESNKTPSKTISGRTGNQNFLPNVIDDDMKVMRPLWLLNGVTGVTALTASSHLERTTRFAGKVKRDVMPAAGSSRYQKEGDIDAKMVVWGTTLYWVTNGWTIRNNGRAGAGKYGLLNLDDGYLYPSNGSMFRVFDGGITSVFSYTVDLEPGTIQGKRALLIKGALVDNRQLWIYLEDGKLTAKLFYDNGTEQSVVLQTKRPVVSVNEKSRVDVQIDADNIGNSFLAVDQIKYETTTTGTWPAGGDTFNAVPDTDEAVLGVNGSYPDMEALDEGMKSFVGYVYQMRASAGEEITLNEGLDGVGVLADSANTDLLLLLEEGEGWSMDNSGSAAIAKAAINGASGNVPVMEDLAHGDEKNPYSLDQFRATLYGTNGKGRQFYAKWTGDFVTNPNGWESGFSGILAPQHFPRVRETATAGTNLSAGSFLVAYSYLDSTTGMRSNPSPIIPLTLSGNFKIEIEDLQASEDPRVDGIEVWMTQSGGSYIGRVALTGNEAQAVVLDYAADFIRSGDELSFRNGIPPLAKKIKFINGRAHWAGIEGSEGVHTFSEFDYEESWNALNQKQVDSSRWSPIVGFGGQRGAIHIYTRDSISRVIDGGGDITTFQYGVVVSGVGAIDQFSILSVDGMEMFMSRDGLFAFNGASTQFIGEPSTRDLIGVPGIDRGADPRSVPMWAVWDSRRHLGMWFHRGLADAHPSGTAVCMSRRVNDNPGWSDLDFYDVSAAAAIEGIDGIPGIILADSMGYVWLLEDPTSDTDNCLDLDGLGAFQEDESARALKGTWATTAIEGHLAGDGARGFVYMGYTEDAEGVITGYGLNRLLRTPPSAVLVQADVEQTLQVWSKWTLGGFPQIYESGWGPYPAIEMNKTSERFDAAFSPLAGEEALLTFEGVQGNNLRGMENELTANASRLMVGLDYGFLEGIPLREQAMFRALRYSFQYFGAQNFDVQEIVVRWHPEGGDSGPGG